MSVSNPEKFRIGGRGDQRDAMMDRIANGSHRLELKGPSMREKREKVMK